MKLRWIFITNIQSIHSFYEKKNIFPGLTHSGNDKNFKSIRMVYSNNLIESFLN